MGRCWRVGCGEVLQVFGVGGPFLVLGFLLGLKGWLMYDVSCFVLFGNLFFGRKISV